MRINIIFDDNGAGLTQDADALARLLAKLGHDPGFVQYDQMTSGFAALNIYLEKFDARHMATAPKHIMVPNLEWLSDEALAHLPRMNQIWCKTRAAFDALPFSTKRLTGFTSRDLRDPLQQKVMGIAGRKPQAIHLAGKSLAKGTTALIKACWLIHERGLSGLVPHIVIVSNVEITPLPPNMMWVGRATDTELKLLMNAALFHLCPSEVEGWGHYIVEAMSCGGLVVTTDGAPMNEHIDNSCGWLVPARRELCGLYDRYHADHERLATLLPLLLRLNDDHLKEMGHVARTRYENRHASFERQVAACLESLDIHG